MCDITAIAVDYWLVPCRDIDVRSVGLPSQSMKKIWLGPWLKRKQLVMEGESIGDCELQKLSPGSYPEPEPEPKPMPQHKPSTQVQA